MKYGRPPEQAKAEQSWLPETDTHGYWTDIISYNSMTQLEKVWYYIYTVSNEE